MLPRQSNDSRSSSSVANLERVGNLGITHTFPPEKSHAGNISVGKLRRSTQFPVRHPPLHRGVNGVLPVGSEKQMVGPYTRRIVALVANEKPVRDGSKCFHPRKPVGQYRLPASAHERAVSMSVIGGHPIPATVGFFHLLPKPFRRRSFWVGHHLPLARERATRFLPFTLENLSALRTLTLEHMKLTLSVFCEGVGVLADALVCLMLPNAIGKQRSFCGSM